MMGEHAVKLALRCYPTWWREKYGREVQVHATDMVADGHSAIGLTQSLLWGAVRLHMTAQGMPKEYGLWARRTNLSIATAIVPMVIAIPIMCLPTGGFQIDIPGSGESPALRDLNWIGLAILLILLMTVALSVIGWVGLRSGLRRTEASSKLRSLIWIPFLAVVADIALAVPFVRINDWGGLLNGHPSVAHALGTTLTIVFWSGLTMSIISVLVVANLSQLQDSDLGRGAKVATVAAFVLAGNLAGYCLWGTVLLMDAHPAAHGAYLWRSASWQEYWTPTVVFLALGLVVSICSARIASKSWRMLAGATS
jgi:hypothetical protein